MNCVFCHLLLLLCEVLDINAILHSLHVKKLNFHINWIIVIGKQRIHFVFIYFSLRVCVLWCSIWRLLEVWRSHCVLHHHRQQKSSMLVVSILAAKCVCKHTRKCTKIEYSMEFWITSFTDGTTDLASINSIQHSAIQASTPTHFQKYTQQLMPVMPDAHNTYLVHLIMDHHAFTFMESDREKECFADNSIVMHF